MTTTSPRTVLITGAGSGFGKGTAIELARRGHSVIAATETSAQADALATEHPELTTMKLDVTSSDDIARAADLGLDVLINNAGMGVMAPMTTVPMDKVRAIFDVNVFGMVEMCQSVAPGMIERGSGRIINVSSIAGKLASPLTSPYCMTKHAVEAFTISLRGELEPHGVDVCKINPGPYDTGFNDRMVDGITEHIAAGDEATHAANQMIREIVLTDQLDPQDVVTALADLTEADETPLETLLPVGIGEMLQAMLDDQA
ncbi:MAG: SDR family NAD(P)-dependent oxidoreductase [Ilumatobacter sp.]|uniref:SDR family NAD(P)-dependent oxidoreductase n=1 Tax=Ilumatobacter sp. TaxID=1967498 RepID=UPI003C72E780